MLPDQNAKLYIRLFHGRTTKNQVLEDWGLDGPVFGPFDWIHTTYKNHIKMGENEHGDVVAELMVDEDLVYYDGVWYGDWTIFTELNPYYQSVLLPYDAVKAGRIILLDDPVKGDVKN